MEIRYRAGEGRQTWVPDEFTLMDLARARKIGPQTLFFDDRSLEWVPAASHPLISGILAEVFREVQPGWVPPPPSDPVPTRMHEPRGDSYASRRLHPLVILLLLVGMAGALYLVAVIRAEYLPDEAAVWCFVAARCLGFTVLIGLAAFVLRRGLLRERPRLKAAILGLLFGALILLEIGFPEAIGFPYPKTADPTGIIAGLRGSLSSPGGDSACAPANVSGAPRLGHARPPGNTPENQANVVFREVIDRLDTAIGRLNRDVERLSLASILNMEAFSDIGSMRRGIIRLTRHRRALDSFSEDIEHAWADGEENLRGHDWPEEFKDQVLQHYDRARSLSGPSCRNMIESRERTCREAEVILQFLQCRCGHSYAIQEGKIFFQEQSDLKAYNGHTKALGRAMESEADAIGTANMHYRESIDILAQAFE